VAGGHNLRCVDAALIHLGMVAAATDPEFPPGLGMIFQQWGAAGVLAMVAVMVITDKLVWHKRLRSTEAERDHWRDVALTALGVGDVTGPRWLAGLFSGRRRRTPEDLLDRCRREEELRRAQQRVEVIKARAESVEPQLRGRLRRNHWGETVASIARKELPS
jgi:hypothetical protein